MIIGAAARICSRRWRAARFRGYSGLDANYEVRGGASTSTVAVLTGVATTRKSLQDCSLQLEVSLKL